MRKVIVFAPVGAYRAPALAPDSSRAGVRGQGAQFFSCPRESAAGKRRPLSKSIRARANKVRGADQQAPLGAPLHHQVPSRAGYMDRNYSSDNYQWKRD